MKKYFLTVLIFYSGVFKLYSYDFYSKGQEIIASMISDPARFFYEMKADAENTLPVAVGKKYVLNTAIFPSLFPLTYANVSLNYNIYRENRILKKSPQIDLTGGFEYMIGAGLFANQTDKVDDAEFYGYHFGIILSQSVSPKVRSFYGYKHSFSKAKLTVNKNKNLELLGIHVDSFNTEFSEDFILMGMEFLRGYNKYWSLQINYGVSNKTVIAKINFRGKWFITGFNIYPEGAITIHPFWAMHLDF